MSGDFAARSHDLGGGVVARVITTDTALLELGARFSQMEPWSRYGMTAHGLGRYFARDEAGIIRFGVFKNDTIAGLVIVQPGWLRGPYVPFLGILPEHQGKGIGASILGWIAREAAHSGARNAWIAVSDFNARARALYEREGYIAIADIADLVIDGRTEILMRKRL